MQFVTEDEPDLTLPEHSIHRARLEEIKLRTFEWTTSDGETKEGRTLEWWWSITSTKLGPEYYGRKVRGKCNPKITNRANNEFRMWAEALLNREIPVGMAIDTDDLVGLEADIAVGWRYDKKDVRKEKPYEFVSDVIAVENSQANQPPF